MSIRHQLKGATSTKSQGGTTIRGGAAEFSAEIHWAVFVASCMLAGGGWMRGRGKRTALVCAQGSNLIRYSSDDYRHVKLLLANCGTFMRVIRKKTLHGGEKKIYSQNRIGQEIALLLCKKYSILKNILVSHQEQTDASDVFQLRKGIPQSRVP